MNLIEQLGGYEKALQFLKSEKNSLEIDPAFYLDGQEILVDVLDDALLEYRRQHNIFEVGDKIIVTDTRGIDHICTFNEEVKMPDYTAYWFKWRNGVESCLFSKDDFKHATDEEIKAGKRLEVNQ